MLFFQSFVGVMSIDELLSLKLSFGEIEQAVFADGGALPILGNAGKRLFGLGELALFEECMGRVELGFRDGVLDRFAHGLPAVRAQDERRRLSAPLAGRASSRGDPAVEERSRAGRAGDISHLVFGRPSDELSVVCGAPLSEWADEALAAGRK